MFINEELKAITQIFIDQPLSEHIKHQLMQKYVNLEATILRGKVLRGFSDKKIHYIAQAAIQDDDINLAYLFSPFILSNLNKPVLYTTPMTNPVLNILKKYYQADQKIRLKTDNILDSLKLYIELVENEINEVDFLLYSLFKALCRTDISSLFFITSLRISDQAIQQVQDYLNIQIYVIKPSSNDGLIQYDEINMRKLLFKHKDEQHKEICSRFSEMNAHLVSLTETLTHQQVIHLIEDMFYSEHIFEKLSVYSEYIQTQYQNKNLLYRQPVI